MRNRTTYTHWGMLEGCDARTDGLCVMYVHEDIQ